MCLSPDIGEGSDWCSGRWHWQFIWHGFLDLDLWQIGHDPSVRGEYPHGGISVNLIVQEAGISSCLIL